MEQTSTSGLNLPLDDSFVVSTNGEDSLAIFGEDSSDYVLTMTSIRTSLMLHGNARISEDVHEPEVISGGNQLIVSGEVNSIDMAAIFAARIDSFDVPTDLGGV